MESYSVIACESGRFQYPRHLLQSAGFPGFAGNDSAGLLAGYRFDFNEIR